MACAASLGLIILALILALSLTQLRPANTQYYEISFQVVRLQHSCQRDGPCIARNSSASGCEFLSMLNYSVACKAGRRLGEEWT